jgi:DUF4097 and DUF4098 domain-containing protein YvlB
MTEPGAPTSIETFAHSGPADIAVHVQVADAQVEVVLADVDQIAVEIYQGAVTTHFHHGRLVVTAPKRLAGAKDLRVLIRARPGSRLNLSGNKARFKVTGTAESLTAAWSSGELEADTVEKVCRLRTGSGRIRIGASNGQLSLKSGNCDVEVARVSGRGGQFITGGGSLQFGTVDSDLSLITGAGAVSVSDAASGRIRVRTGWGTVHVGVRAGVPAKLDLISRSGTASSDLPVSDAAPNPGEKASGGSLQISATTNSGDIVIGRAA